VSEWPDYGYVSRFTQPATTGPPACSELACPEFVEELNC